MGVMRLNIDVATVTSGERRKNKKEKQGGEKGEQDRLVPGLLIQALL
jgi:hypothetical protein